MISQFIVLGEAQNVRNSEVLFDKNKSYEYNVILTKPQLQCNRQRQGPETRFYIIIY